MTGCASYSPLTSSIISAHSNNSKCKFCFPWALQVYVQPHPFYDLGHTHTHTQMHTQMHTMFINMRRVIGIMQKMSSNWGKILLQGTMCGQYGLGNDRICPQGAWEGVHLNALPGGCSSNLVILSCTILICALQDSASPCRGHSSQTRWLTFTPIVLSR